VQIFGGPHTQPGPAQHRRRPGDAGADGEHPLVVELDDLGRAHKGEVQRVEEQDDPLALERRRRQVDDGILHDSLARPLWRRLADGKLAAVHTPDTPRVAALSTPYAVLHLRALMKSRFRSARRAGVDRGQHLADAANSAIEARASTAPYLPRIPHPSALCRLTHTHTAHLVAPRHGRLLFFLFC
jgi:hypothetical protein